MGALFACREGGGGNMDIPALVAAMCIPSALTGFCFWMLERRIARREAEQDPRDERRDRAR